MEKLKAILKVAGWIVLVAGVVLGYADLRDVLRYPEREAFIHWATEEQTGLPLEPPAAQAFIQRFPPPGDEQIANLTHVTKWKTRLAGGPVLDASFNYMRRDQSRTQFVATLSEVLLWASESQYAFLSWLLTAVGAAVVLASETLELVGKRKADKVIASAS